MAEKQKNVASLVADKIRDPLDKAGYGIWDVEFVKEGSDWYLRITIDKEDGVDIDDCEKAFRIVDPIITDLDPVENSYHLEVSSPGLERDLRTQAHFNYCIGKEIVLKLFTAVNNQRELKGTLLSADENGTLTLLVNGSELTIEKKKISKANLYFDFDSVDMDENFDETEDLQDSGNESGEEE